MIAVPTSFSDVEDLNPVLDELASQADAVLASIFTIQNMRKNYAKTTDSTEKSEYAKIIREHGVALGTDLGIIRLNAEFVANERLEMWVNEALSAADRADGKGRVECLTAKMRDLESEMSALKSGMEEEDDGS